MAPLLRSILQVHPPTVHMMAWEIVAVFRRFGLGRMEVRGVYSRNLEIPASYILQQTFLIIQNQPAIRGFVVPRLVAIHFICFESRKNFLGVDREQSVGILTAIPFVGMAKLRSLIRHMHELGMLLLNISIQYQFSIIKKLFQSLFHSRADVTLKQTLNDHATLA